MKRYILFIISLLALFTSIKLHGQILITKTDTIAFGKDSISVLTIPKSRGKIYWQQSFDLKNWLTSSDKGLDSLTISTGFNSYYRAQIVDGDCFPIYSDTIKIQISDSVKTVLANGLLEMAYPDSVGVPVTFTGANGSISCMKINGEYVYQGDIILSQQQINYFINLKGASINPQYIANFWPDGVVYYNVSTAALLYNFKIEKAIRHWEQNTPIRFLKRTNQADYIEFVLTLNENCSLIGKQGDKQDVKISYGSDVGTIIHELGHAIGLVHEQQRPDWFNYIKIETSNILEQYKNQYETQPYWIGNGTFDYYSIMCYPCYSDNFAKDRNKPVITLLNGLTWDPQRNALSNGDIEMVKLLYQPVVLFLKYPRESVDKPFTYILECGIHSNTKIITDKGICWSTGNHPTILNETKAHGGGTGFFNMEISDLRPDTYYFRAYAITSAGEVFYSNAYSYKTSNENKSGVFTDSRDNKTYKWVKIGAQTWMAENLAYLPSVSPSSQGSVTTPYYYVYDYQGTTVAAAKQNANYIAFGVLYNWPAAMNGSSGSVANPSRVQGVCPSGWHIPSQSEGDQLAQYISNVRGPYTYEDLYGKDWMMVGYHLKAKSGWPVGSNGNDDFGFAGLPGGERVNFGIFLNYKVGGMWWNSNSFDSDEAWDFNLHYNSTVFHTAMSLKDRGHSVRCVKDNY